MGNRGGGVTGVDRQGVLSTPESDKKPSPITGGSFVSVVFVVRGSGRDVCGGRIGDDAAKFCALPCLNDQTSCGRFVKHTKAKAPLKCPAYYIGVTGKPGGSAFCQPVLVAPPNGFSLLALSVVNDITTPRTVADWREVFTVLSGFESFTPSEQRKVLERINTKIHMGPTPMRPRKLINLTDNSEELSEVSDSWGVNLPNMYSALMLEDAEGGSPTDCFSQMQSHWNDVIHALAVHRRNLEKIDGETTDVLEEIDNKLVKVISALGVQTKEAPAPDLWSSVAANANHLGSSSFLSYPSQQHFLFLQICD